MVDLSVAFSADDPTKLMVLVSLVDALLLSNPRPILQLVSLSLQEPPMKPFDLMCDEMVFGEYDDDLNCTMEEYISAPQRKIKLENMVKCVNWETAKLVVIGLMMDIHDPQIVKQNFSSIALNDEVSSEALFCEPTLIRGRSEQSQVSIPSLWVCKCGLCRPPRILVSIKIVITEYSVNISKRRAFWSLNEDILKINDSNNQYAVSIKEDTAYPCLHSPKTTKERRSIRRI
ncbi:hypothetical protein Tco_0657779 [Tanacetum coccineum]